MGNPGFTIDWQINRLEVSRAGDLAYAIYTYQMSLDGPNGKPITDQGKDLAVLERSSRMVLGKWSLILLIRI